MTTSLRIRALLEPELEVPGRRHGKPPKGARFQTRNAIAARLGRNAANYGQVVVKVIKPWAKGPLRTKAQINYITRDGEIRCEDELGRELEGKDEVHAALEAWDLRRDHWEGCRTSMHLMFSMNKDTEGLTEDKLIEAVRRTLRDEFGSDPDPLRNRQYVFVKHTLENDPEPAHNPNPHVHAVIRYLNGRREPIRPGPEDLWRYREVFAEKLREQGVRANASPAIERFVVKRGEPDMKWWHLKRDRNRSHVLTRHDREIVEMAGTAGFVPTPGEQRYKARYAQAKRDYEAAADAIATDRDPRAQALAKVLRSYPQRFTDNPILEREARAAQYDRFKAAKRNVQEQDR